METLHNPWRGRNKSPFPLRERVRASPDLIRGWGWMSQFRTWLWTIVPPPFRSSPEWRKLRKKSPQWGRVGMGLRARLQATVESAAALDTRFRRYNRGYAYRRATLVAASLNR